ncbi:DNA cytosine methyltransferase [Undibacterium sp. Di27W]|uniref:DNA cytosine methyltransferase n=1 Tax=Undibacterium sp. Di27W TaxID=3413036 RepID=UPI003BF43B63
MSVQKKQIRSLTVIDLFSGAGGFSLAALNSGLHVLAAIEFDNAAAETYQKNIVEKYSPNTKLLPFDILEINPKDFRESLDLEKGHLDMLIGGPPCQGFSTHRINGKGIDDPRNKLLLRYFDFVKELKPKIFLVENVPGLLWKRHEKYLKQFNELAEENGYQIFKPIKVNAKDYGVPQNRDRVFILGVSKSIDIRHLTWPPHPTHFSPTEGGQTWLSSSVVFEKPPEPTFKKLKQILGKEKVNSLVFGQPTLGIDLDPSALHMTHTQDLLERIQITPINGSREDIAFRLPCHSNAYKGHKDVYGRIRLAQPGPTITTGCFNPSKGRFLHPWLNHGITIRHAARLQTFPDDFVFTNGITSQGKQVGNAVPVKLGEQLITTLRNFLVDSNKLQIK